MLISLKSETNIISNINYLDPLSHNIKDHDVPTSQFTSDWKIKRRQLTVFYGYLTFAITIIFIIILPWWNRVSNYLYYKVLQLSKNFKIHPKISVLKVNPMSTQMIIFWTIILSFLSLCQTNWDLRFIASRLGRVPVYCLPTVLFLTLRPSPLSDVLYLQLLPIHKWLSRLVVLQSLLHTIAYLYIMGKTNSFEKLNRFDNKNGIYAMFAFLIIFFTSLPFIRRHFYRIFFINHYICTWIVTITLYLHVRPGIPYLTLLNCLILIYQIYYKFKISKISVISTMKISDHMLVVDLPNNSISSQFNLPGCHIRLIDYNENHSKFWNILKNILVPIQHPYTLASLPVDKSQKLIVRISTYQLQDRNKYFITGSYLPHLNFIKGLSSNSNSLNQNNTSLSMIAAASTNNNPNNINSLLVETKVKKCLIVVGGSAISFALPILRVLHYNGAMVKIIWVIRDHEDLKALDYFQNYLINDDCIDIFITGKYTTAEKENFKEALNELHKRKMEQDLKQETEILSGGYSYYNTTKSSESLESDTNKNTNIKSNSSKNFNSTLIDSNNTRSNSNSTNSSGNNKYASSFLSSNKSLDSDIDNNQTIDNVIDNQMETSPLNPDHSKNYGSSIFNPQVENMHRKSYIDFKSHNQKISNSYNDETIDIELNDGGRYKQNLAMLRQNNHSKLTPSAGVGYSANNTQYNQEDISEENNVKNNLPSKDKKKSVSPIRTGNYISDIVPKSFHLESSAETSPNKARKLPLNTAIPSAFSSHLNNKLLSGTASISTSSALYDDLENYWVLKHSFSHIEFGRPKLGLQYYSWCIGSSCTGPLIDLKSGKSVCYNIREDPMSGFNDELNELYSNHTFLANRKARFTDRNGEPDETIWVIGAGPDGLVDNARLWANDCGFSFHEESFII